MFTGHCCCRLLTLKVTQTCPLQCEGQKSRHPGSGERRIELLYPEVHLAVYAALACILKNGIVASRASGFPSSHSIDLSRPDTSCYE